MMMNIQEALSKKHWNLSRISTYYRQVKIPVCRGEQICHQIARRTDAEMTKK